MKRGANPNALDAQRYDIVTIAAVANDVPMLKVALEGGASAKNVTSPYDGTALIAAAHLGHDEVVKVLIVAGAPLDHVNNLRWTACDRGDRSGQRRQAAHRNAARADRRRREPEPQRRAGHTPLPLAPGGATGKW